MPSARSAVLCVAALVVTIAAVAPTAVSAKTKAKKAPKAPHVTLVASKRCDFLLGGTACLAPFPNDYFTVPVKHPAKGLNHLRVNFDPRSMPVNQAGVPIDPTQWNLNDGFSPGITAIVKIPGLDNAQAFARTGLVASGTMAKAFAKDQAVVVIDAATGQRQQIWTELDAGAATDAARNLEIHPAKNYLEGHRYIVALRNLKTAAGTTIKAPTAFRIYRDRLRSTQPTIVRRRAHMESIFASLKKAKIDRRSLWAAWDFTISSETSITQRQLAIRNDAYRQLGDTNLADGKVQGITPHFDIKKVTNYQRCDPDGCKDGQDADLRRQVEGTFNVPCYLTSPRCVPGGVYNFGPNGLPVQQPGNVDTEPFICNIPWSAKTGTGVHRLLPVLYGHGLFGNYTEAGRSRNVRQLGNDEGAVVCGASWQGMADEDVVRAATALLDLSKFNQLTDRLQQGFLGFMYLGRLLTAPGGLADNRDFKIDGQSTIDRSHVEYYGNSQGGIMGGALTAMSPDLKNSVLYVPGMTYSVLLPRSVDFDDPTSSFSYADLLYGRKVKTGGYPDTSMHPLIFDLAQMLWDRGEPSGYAQHMTSDPLPNTPPHNVLIEMSIGDHQVANITAETEARTIGARFVGHPFDAGRPVNDDPLVGFQTLGALPQTGSAIIPWDIGPLRQQDGKTMGTPWPPADNRPNTLGQDPHDYVINNTPALRHQIATYLKTGQIVDVCGGRPCRTSDWTG
jgi:hypothetical protein